MVSLKPRGPMRFFAAVFLLFWLCGWAAGECFALWFLGNGAVALMSGTPFMSGRAPVQAGPAIAVGVFLLFWLTLWTMGGFAAIGELLRQVWAEDRLLVEGAGLVVVRSRGPFRRHREFPRDTLRRMFLTPGAGALAVESSGATVEISRLGTFEEREAAATALRAEIGLSETDTDAAVVNALPKGWEETITPEGERAVIPDRRVRRVQARVAAVFAFLLGAATVAIVRQSLLRREMIPVAIQFVLGTIALACAASWLTRGRMEWRVGSGRMTLRRRFGANARDVFEAQRFEVTVERGSKGGDWFALEAVSDPAGAPPAPPTWRTLMRNRRRITSVANDPSIPRQLGAYLARAGGVSLEDRTTVAARKAEFEAMKEQLEKSGPLGRFAVRFVAQAQDRTRKPA